LTTFAPTRSTVPTNLLPTKWAGPADCHPCATSAGSRHETTPTYLVLALPRSGAWSSQQRSRNSSYEVAPPLRFNTPVIRAPASPTLGIRPRSSSRTPSSSRAITSARIVWSSPHCAGSNCSSVGSPGPRSTGSPRVKASHSRRSASLTSSPLSTTPSRTEVDTASHPIAPMAIPRSDPFPTARQATDHAHSGEGPQRHRPAVANADPIVPLTTHPLSTTTAART